VDKANEIAGGMILFHPAERFGALPHGNTSGDTEMAATRAEFEERLCGEFEDFEQGGDPLGILWVSVDQGHCLRKTHGIAACHEMMAKVQHALQSGLRPSEEMARWGEDDFLIIAHERTAEMLARHANTLAGLARTADFRWWGDRITLTVSVGAAQAYFKQSLKQLLERARRAMETSMHAGGNRVTCVQREQEGSGSAGEDLICTPS
jgi:diguanylate cyclase (GGDEF)-like protein